MATADINPKCSICNQEYDIYSCTECGKNFCYTDLPQHREKIKQDFHHTEHDLNSFQQKLLDQKQQPMNHSLIDKINQWENTSIEKIKETADKCRQKLMNFISNYLVDIEKKLKNLFEKLRKIDDKNQFSERSLKELKRKLNKLEEEFERPANVLIEEGQTSSFINKIFVNTSIDKGTQIISPITDNNQWKQYGITVAGGNEKGKQLDQLDSPWGLFIDNDQQSIYIADRCNDRIVEWKFNAKTGQVIAGGNGKGNQMNQLNRPTDVLVDTKNNSLVICDQGNRRVVQWCRQNGTKDGRTLICNVDCWGIAMDKNEYIYVSDTEKNEVNRWKRGERSGVIVAGGNGKGNNSKQLNGPTYLFVDQDDAVYVSDTENHRIMKWVKNATEGIIVAGGQGQGNGLTQLSQPRGVIVDRLGDVYVVDWGNHRVMCWSKGSTQGRIIIGEHGQGKQSNQLNQPTGISFDRNDNLYVVDYRNHRVQKFDICTY